MQQNKENEPKTAYTDNNTMSVEEITLIRDKFDNFQIRGRNMMVCIDTEHDRAEDFKEVVSALRMHFGGFFENRQTVGDFHN